MILAAKIAYDGSKFFGFARQNGYRSVVQRIEEVLQTFGITCNVVGAGRTDRGVHATGQVIRMEIPDFWQIERFLKLFNQKLYPDIFVRRIWHVKEEFHPRFQAKKREYRYIFGKFYGNVWLSPYISKENFGNVEKIKQGLGLFVGKKDFKFFSKTCKENKSTEREIYKTYFYTHQIFGQKYYIAGFQANGFLYSQIRLMMGAILAYSLDQISLQDLQDQIQGVKRVYSYPASPNGLYLTKVIY
ncbi:tRNA pseudouridine(38-40) synthase TruA [Helicobacter anatolicus]|uniref:tRNA pseudouridine(38-40) synthase TruA n=1 Tax=Helicobacter anatolicus TaxID=2905874 RepID=UPI001E488C8F|nr:tRNA pseudouridine(38-40) synthase TruA [Helicobacter anatolicus]MCE3038307.1 tRNA pseudouridine(38-40) synthase TruA [Helicobacter anatolicus]